MARRMAVVGRVTVSLRRSIMATETPERLRWKAARHARSAAGVGHRIPADRRRGSGGWEFRSAATPRFPARFLLRAAARRKTAPPPGTPVLTLRAALPGTRGLFRGCAAGPGRRTNGHRPRIPRRVPA